MEQRYDAVMEVLKEGRTVVEVAARYGVSRQSVHNWITLYQEEGIEALANRSSRPRGCPHQMPPELKTRVVQMRLAHPRWGPKTIAFQLARAGVDAVPSPSGIKRALRRRGLVEYSPRRRKKKEYRRWERDRAMELWQMDVVGEILLKDGTELKAATGVDDHSRYCVSAKLVRRATSRAVCDALLQALERHGVPDELLTDNARVFTGRIGPHPVEVLFDRICRENGHPPPAHGRALSDHHGQDRALPQDASRRLSGRSLPHRHRPGPGGSRSVSGGVQHLAPSSVPRHGDSCRALRNGQAERRVQAP